MGSADRMAASDAVYVEGLITNGGGLGFMDPIATGKITDAFGYNISLNLSLFYQQLLSTLTGVKGTIN